VRVARSTERTKRDGPIAFCAVQNLERGPRSISVHVPQTIDTEGKEQEEANKGCGQTLMGTTARAGLGLQAVAPDGSSRWRVVRCRRVSAEDSISQGSASNRLRGSALLHA
jgi:hypothetical protein